MLIFSIVQLVGHEPFAVLKPIVEELLEKQEKNKQRGAAEFLAGLLAGQLALHYVLTLAPKKSS